MEFSQRDEDTSNRFREQFLDEVIEQEEDIDSLIDFTAKSIGDNVQVDDPDKLDRYLRNAFLVFGASYITLLILHNKNAVEISTNQQKSVVTDKYNNPSFDVQNRQTAERLITDVEQNLLNRSFAPFDYKTIGERIVTLQDGALRTTRDIIYLGLQEGRSAKQIADDIANYLKPSEDKAWTSPFEWFRERFNYQTGKPKDRLGGSLHYNAIRIARTEINYSYRRTTVKMHQNKPWVKGFEWRLSPAHPIYDICDDWAADSPYKDENDIPPGHPFCLCTVVAILADKGELDD